MMLRMIPVTDRFDDLAKVEALALEAFPPEEYLSPETLIHMAGEEGLDFWALYDAEIFVGFMTVMTHKTMAYLFFLAIDKQQRSKGYGGKALEALRAAYPGRQQVVDMEKPDDAAENRLQRQKRRQFYLRNGYRPTGQFLSYLGVDYEVLCTEEHFDFDMFRELMSGIRIKDFSPRYYTE